MDGQQGGLSKSYIAPFGGIVDGAIIGRCQSPWDRSSAKTDHKMKYRSMGWLSVFHAVYIMKISGKMPNWKDVWYDSTMCTYYIGYWNTSITETCLNPKGSSMLFESREYKKRLRNSVIRENDLYRQRVPTFRSTIESSPNLRQEKTKWNENIVISVQLIVLSESWKRRWVHICIIQFGPFLKHMNWKALCWWKIGKYWL